MTDEQIERYSRHIILKEVGGKGQQKLFDGRVLIIGAGGLGAPIALYLAAAGVGTIGIADADDVDLSNLQRQVIHFTPDVGKPKVESAREKIEAINPDVKVITYREWISAANINRIIADYDFIIDGTDNFAAKFLINDACVLAGKPYSHGGILQFVGQTITVLPGMSTCYRCVFPTPPPKDAIPTCSQAGVIGVLTVAYNVPLPEATAITILDWVISVLSIIVFGAILYVVSPMPRGMGRIPQPAAPSSAPTAA